MGILASYISMGVDAHPSQKGLCCVELGFEAPCILFTALYRLILYILLTLVHCMVISACKGTINLKPLFHGQ